MSTLNINKPKLNFMHTVKPYSHWQLWKLVGISYILLYLVYHILVASVAL